VGIICVERVIVGVADLAASKENWRRAGFAVAPEEFDADGIRFARLAAGAVEIDLCTITSVDTRSMLAAPLREAATNEGAGAIIGWVWGEQTSPVQLRERAPTVTRSAGEGSAVTIPSEGNSILLPGLTKSSISASMLSSGFPGVVTAIAPITLDIESRRQSLAKLCGANANSVDYLEHIVVMTPVLDDAIKAHEAIGVPCKRIREIGNGAKQAFFKLEQTVIEVVGPARGRPGCWGLALMCTDIAKAVSVARANGLQATEPKQAIQGGQIARIVDPIDGVAIAFMQSGPRRDD
jgi:predicted enzyme related to lactoylglutathione lyase